MSKERPEVRDAVLLEVESLEELITIASSLPFPVVNVDISDQKAFLILQPSGSSRPIIYFCGLKKVPEEKFAHVDRVNAKIRFSNLTSDEPNVVSVPIIRIKGHNIRLST